MASQLQTRSPQDTTNQIDDNFHSYAIVPASPQYTDGHSVPSTPTVDSSSSPYTTPSILHSSHARLTEFSLPSVSNNPHAYSPSLASNPQAYSPEFTSPTTPASAYIPPPSPTPNQKYSLSPQEEYQYYLQGNETSQQRQYMYDHQQQQTLTEPILNSYPEPTLVAFNEKPDQGHPSNPTAATSLVNNGRRKKMIWIGVTVTLLVIGVTLGLVFGLNDKNSNKNSSGYAPTGSWPNIQFPTGFPTDFPFPSNFPTGFPTGFPYPMPSGFPSRR